MTGRRILDAAAVFKAVRGVASNHVVFRTHQLDAFSKTSTIAKAVKSQTDRVTLTVKAASALADRCNGPATQNSTQATRSATAHKDPPTPNAVEAESLLRGTKEVDGSVQDHLYTKLGEQPAGEPLVANGLNVEQKAAEGHPPSDVSISPLGSLSDASKRLREPSSKISKKGVGPPDEETHMPEPPASPQLNVARKTHESYQDHDLAANSQIYRDVSYPSNLNGQNQAVPECQAIPEQEQPCNEAYSEIFHSPRVARMLGGQSKIDLSSKGLELPGAKGMAAEEIKSPEENDRVSSSVRTPASNNFEAPSSLSDSSDMKGAKERKEEHVYALAAEMANEAEKIQSGSSSVSAEILRSARYSAD